MQTTTNHSDGYKPKKNTGWCPYCGKETAFVWDSRLSVARCSECGVSVWDFYARVLNGLSKDADLERFERSVKLSDNKYSKSLFWEAEKQ